MGRPRQPTALALVKGNPGKRAAPKGEPEPLLQLYITPPAHLPEHVAAVWHELAPQLRDAKILTQIDGPALEMACEAVASFRLAMTKTADGKPLVRNEETGNVSLSPWEMVKSMAFKRGMAALREFGATPAARSRVIVNPQGDLFDNSSGPGRFFG